MPVITMFRTQVVIILIIMEDGLVHDRRRQKVPCKAVLILIVVEDGLVQP